MALISKTIWSLVTGGHCASYSGKVKATAGYTNLITAFLFNVHYYLSQIIYARAKFEVSRQRMFSVSFS